MQRPDDAEELARLLYENRTSLMPLPSRSAASREQLHELSIIAAEWVARPDRPATPAERAITYWEMLYRGYQLVAGDPDGEPPSDQANTACMEILVELEKLVKGPAFQGSTENTSRYQLGARRRAWLVRRMGPPYADEENRQRLSSICTYRNECLGWPIAPLTRDPAFRAFVEGLVDQRARDRSWPAPFTDGYMRFEREAIERDEPTDDEVDGRQLFVLWGGLDQYQVDKLTEQLAAAAAPQRLHERLARTGFTPTPPKPPTDPALLSALVAAAPSIDKLHATFVASCFNARTSDPVTAIEKVCAEVQPQNVKELLAALPLHPFESYAITKALAGAGLGRDVTLAKVNRKDLVVAGDCKIAGDVTYATIAVSGDLTIGGALVAPYDVIVGGTLTAKSIYAEGSEGVLSVVGDVVCPKVEIDEHDFEHLGKLIKTKAPTAKAKRTKAKPKAKPKAKGARKPAKAKARTTSKRR